MKWIHFVEDRMQNLTTAIRRFPLTILFLIIASITTAVNIQTESFEDYELMLTGLVGALAAAVAQMIYERFYRDNSKLRLLMYLAAIGLAVLFYMVTVMDGDLFAQRVYLRTIVLSFSLFIAFIWVPTIQHEKLAFSDSFTAAFKAVFTTLLFSFVLIVGVTAILSAISALLIEVDYRFYLHANNVIGLLFAPLFFLASIPKYSLPNEIEPSMEVRTAVSVPKIMNVLLTYIIIPIVMVFTVILALYILMNIGQDFWVNNLLEPMLVIYSITVILVMLLIGRLDNKIANGFRMIFPKILFFIVLLQTIASVIQISEKGLTVGRYYVILFGVFAIIASIIFSIWPKQKNGLVAVVLIAFSAISIIPPVDAFTVSKNGQIAFLRSVLEDNQMLEGNQIVPRSDVPSTEQQKIVATMSDLEELEALEEVPFLPADYPQSNTFEETFGFEPFGGPAQEFKYYYFEWNNEVVLDTSDYDAVTKIQLNTIPPGDSNAFEQTIEIEGENYQLMLEEINGDYTLTLMSPEGQTLVQHNLSAVTDELSTLPQTNADTLTIEQALFTAETEAATLDLVLLQLNQEGANDHFYLEGFVFVGVK